MRKHQLSRQNSIGAALVVTLIVCAVLAMVVVALMQNTSLDRATSSSVANQYRAKLAADSGVAAAKLSIAKRTESDNFIVLRAEGELGGKNFPVFYIGEPAASSISYYPLFSGGAVMPGLGITQIPPAANAFPAAVKNDTKQQATGTLEVLPHITSGGSVPVGAGWVKVEDADGKVVGRYAYWAEDLGGYLDADIAGAKPLKRDKGTNAAELGLFTLFRPQEKEDSAPSDGLDAQLVTYRASGPAGGSMLYSLKTLGLPPFGLGDGFAADGSYNPANDYQQFFAVGMKYYEEPPLIPQGFGYANAGLRKSNINASIAKGGEDAVREISENIKLNLPDFDKRKGGFPASQDYVKTIAANIVDYADADSDATVGTDFRGVDSYPFLTQIWLQLWWVNGAGTGALIPDVPWYTAGTPATWRGKIKARYHIQVWNPSDKPASGTLRLELGPSASPGENYAFFFDGNELKRLYPLPGGLSLEEKFDSAAGTDLKPNEYRAISFPEMEYEVDTGLSATQPRPAFGSSSTRGLRLGNTGLPQSADSNQHGYAIYWNNRLVDRPGPIQHGNSANVFERKIAGTFPRWPATSGEGPTWRGGLPGLRQGLTNVVTLIDPTTGASLAQNAPLLGDPRGSFYLDGFINAHDYAQNASWWGRLFISTNSSSGFKNQFIAQARLSAWPDGAHQDAADAGLPLGDVSPGTATANLSAKRSTTPAAAPNMVAIASRLNRIPPPIVLEKAPARISNAGQLDNIAELGNVYDPIQWRPNFQPLDSIDSAAQRWRDMGNRTDIDAQMFSDSRFVVPSTLRIGRGEFAKFDTNGQRASQLLDLFTVADGSASTKGLVNINSASKDVLRALGAGIKIESDKLIKPPGFPAGPMQTKEGDLLAAAIVAGRPFISVAQLAALKSEDGSTAFFGNPKMWPVADRPDEWLDVAAEEYFRKMFGLVSVRNRNFRIFVVGQALASDGATVLATSKKECQIAVEPQRSPVGLITGTKVLTIREKSL